ncbi:MAG: ABC transporter permease [Planctomycetes bacterium]|nr:ABC transporter permease [Planctomycetota bacterium]
MTALWRDVRYALRQLWNSRRLTAVVILVLALGIGANTAIFSVINGVLLKSLPVRDPQDLRVISWMGSDTGIGGFTSDMRGPRVSGKSSWLAFPYPTYREFAENAEGFSHLLGFSYVDGGVTIRAGGAPAVAHGLMVSGNFFDGYGAGVLFGRSLAPQDDRAGADPVAAITYRLWERYYDLDPRVLGQTLLINNAGFTIVGVLPQRFRGPLHGDPTDFYVPFATQALLTSDEERLEDRRIAWVRIMGRLAPGANETQARASLEVLFPRTLSRPPAQGEPPTIPLADGRHGLAVAVSDQAGGLMMLQGLVGLVLLIACANVAGLLLARSAGRRQELSVRVALGAGRWHLIRQSLVESLFLSLGGAAAGLVVSVWLKAVLAGPMTSLVRSMYNDLDYMPLSSAGVRLGQGLDGTVLLFTLGVAVFTTLLFGLLPAWRAGCVDPLAELKTSGAQGTRRSRWGRVLVVVQMALSLLLVVWAGLLIRTIVNLRQVDPGYDTENLLVFDLRPLESVVKGDDLISFHERVRMNLAAIPGVRSVAFSSGGWYPKASVPDLAPETVLVGLVSDGWLATMGVNLLAGRDFTSADIRGSEPVAIVNEALARHFFPGANPVGMSITTGGMSGRPEPHQIVGVCSSYRRDVHREPQMTIYFCQRQNVRRGVNFAVRSVLPALALVPAVRRAVAEIDPGLPLEELATQKQLLEKSLSPERTLRLLFVGLGLLALGLSCLGLYGLMAHHVTGRTGEIGLRMALGARPADVARPILREAGRLALLGIALGLPLTLALARVLGAFIFDIAPYDPVTLIASGVILLAVALVAAWLPARRAARIDPMVALRYE